ncbi:MAG: transposase [Nostocaceae cyanobacterium]|nr:transposase [Nostocaceae cyanobacterium]
MRLFIQYKANIAGIPVVFVPPAYTSQVCSHCLHIHPDPAKSFRNRKNFVCGYCGTKCDADYNAARNIAVFTLDRIQMNLTPFPSVASSERGVRRTG